MNTLQDLWNRLTTPRAVDADTAQREYIIKVLVVIITIVPVVMFPIATIGWIAGWVPSNYVIVAALLSLTFGVSLWLAHQGHWRISSYLVLIAGFASSTYTNYIEGAGTSATLFYAILVVLAAKLYGTIAQWITMLICFATYIGISAARIQGLIPPVPAPEAVFPRLAMMIFLALVGITLLQWFFNAQHDKVLTQSRTYAAELAENKANLENQIAARTAELQKLADADRKAREELEQMVTAYNAFIQRVAQGDLRMQLEVTTGGDMGRLGLRLNGMVVSLRELAAQSVSAAQRIANSTSEILTATEQQFTSAQTQASTIAETGTTVAEIKQVAEEMSDRAQQTADLAEETAKVSQEGVNAVRDTIQGMTDIQSRVTELAETILALSEQTQKIGDIIETVEEIAEQSQILSLNASVEAARAGEVGKGFAVVAQEVRALSEQSQAATAEVRNIIQDIQKATNTAVLTTEEASKSVQRGESLTTQAGQVIVKLGARIKAAAHAARQIVASAGQQVGGLEQISWAMDDLNNTMQETVKSVEQTKSAGQDLDNLAHLMTEVVSQYHLD